LEIPKIFFVSSCASLKAVRSVRQEPVCVSIEGCRDELMGRRAPKLSANSFSSCPCSRRTVPYCRRRR